MPTFELNLSWYISQEAQSKHSEMIIFHIFVCIDFLSQSTLKIALCSSQLSQLCFRTLWLNLFLVVMSQSK